jgi:hypothetical protein
LHTLQTLSEVGLSVKETLQEARIADLVSTAGRWPYIQEALEKMCSAWQQQGHSPALTIQELLEEVYFCQEECFQLFLKKIFLLKFFILVGFYLSTYFLYLLALIGRILVVE